jgi:hypothetical protein
LESADEETVCERRKDEGTLNEKQRSVQVDAPAAHGSMRFFQMVLCEARVQGPSAQKRTKCVLVRGRGDEIPNTTN